MMPDITVIVPVYNGKRYIEKVVSTLSAQTMSGFEVLFVDDGSTDGSAEMFDELLLKDMPFSCRVIHQKNGGVSSARNTGLRNAAGKYVCFVDVDDQIAADYLETLLSAITSTGQRVAVAHITRDASDLLNSGAADTIVWKSLDFLREFLYRGIKYSICACMFEKDCFIGNELFFPEGYRYSEDVYVLWQLFAREQQIAEIHRKLYLYYDNPYSAMNQRIDIRRMDAIKLMKKLESILGDLSPEFAPEFKQYAVARHHWSILWQAAMMIGNYREFTEYCREFAMKEELKKLLTYPEARISLSSRIYLVSPWMYYRLLRIYMKLTNKYGG